MNELVHKRAQTKVAKAFLTLFWLPTVLVLILSLSALKLTFE